MEATFTREDYGPAPFEPLTDADLADITRTIEGGSGKPWSYLSCDYGFDSYTEDGRFISSERDCL